MRSTRQHCGARSAWAGIGAFAALLLALGAGAAPARAQNVTTGEFMFGVLAHDAHFLGGKEDGVDLNPEFDLPSPIADTWVANLPGYLRWALQPRPMVGLDGNTAGETDQFYFGLNWAWQVASNLLRPGDGIVIAYSFGPGFNNGEIHSTDPDRKSLGGHVLFREALDIGYRITPVYEVSLHVDHISNGGFDQYNQSINDVGIRFGVRF
jgi:lipid A 3-O-deacylase